MNTNDRMQVLAQPSASADMQRGDEILTPEALAFLTRLHDQFAGRRHDRLDARMQRRAAIDNGRDLRFLDETRGIREDASWRVAGPGPGLEDRRVEITGPTDAKMAINALNSGAKVWLADQEDATSPTWANVIGGQVTLFDAIRGQLEFTSAEGKQYAVTAEHTPTIVMRPRGWHLVEKHLRYVDPAGIASPASGSLVDFGLYFFHNAKELIARGSGPYFYLAKTENHLEARLWDDVFTFSENALGIPHGTIRATVLIETLPAAFQMDEILYELRDHSYGLNAGRWDYIFSMIKCFRDRPEFVLPDRTDVKMTVPFMHAYTELLVQTCHKRGAFAMGGMAAFIPSRRDPEVNAIALAKVRDDKTREAGDGFDGSWVAHPDLVPVCKEVFDSFLGAKPNQLDKQRPDVSVSPADLLAVAKTPGGVTEAGLRSNISVGLQYLANWLGGNGAVAIFNLMEDAATAEISRSQVWQWIHNEVILDDGPLVTKDVVERMIDEELVKIRELAGDSFDAARYGQAVALFTEVALADSFVEFLTLPAYERMP